MQPCRKFMVAPVEVFVKEEFSTAAAASDCGKVVRSLFHRMPRARACWHRGRRSGIPPLRISMAPVPADGAGGSLIIVEGRGAVPWFRTRSNSVVELASNGRLPVNISQDEAECSCCEIHKQAERVLREAIDVVAQSAATPFAERPFAPHPYFDPTPMASRRLYVSAPSTRRANLKVLHGWILVFRFRKLIWCGRDRSRNRKRLAVAVANAAIYVADRGSPWRR